MASTGTRRSARESLRGLAAQPEALLLAALGLWSLLPFAILFAGSDPGVFNGSDGIQVADHLQYLAWARDAGADGLFSNRFDLLDDPELFFHPLFFLTGLVWKAGVSLQLSYLLWKPLAVAVLFAGFAVYVRRTVPPPRLARMAALALALFFFSPAAPLVDWLGSDDAKLLFGTEVMGLELFAAGYTWGGFATCIAVGLMPLYLLGIERLVERGSRPERRSWWWYGAWTGLGGALVSWFHPWQGVTLLMILVGLAVWARFGRRYTVLALPAALTAAPLVYYFALSHTDSAWNTVSQPNDYEHFGLWFVLGLAPLLLALPGLRVPVEGIQDRVLRLWPAAGFVLYFAMGQSWFYHALVSLSLPLAVLAVRGWQRLGIPRPAAAAAIAALTLPGMVWSAAELEKGRGEHFLAEDEARALEHVEDSARPGGVLSPLEIGSEVPAFTGRRSWLGHDTWTPSNRDRAAQAERLFEGELPPAETRELVRATGARFLVADCRDRASLEPVLRSALARIRRFGCATVYELR